MTDIETLRKQLDYIKLVKKDVDEFFAAEISNIVTQISLFNEKEKNDIIAEWIQRGKDGLNKNIDDSQIPEKIKNDCNTIRRQLRDECPFEKTDPEACRDCKNPCWPRAKQLWREKYNF